MHRTVRPALLAAVAAALLTTGCATTVTGTATSAGASSPLGTTATQGDPVAWVNGVCGSLLPFVKAASVPPNVNPSNPRAAVSGLSDYFGEAVTSLDTALNGLKAAGPSPVAGGDEVVTTLTSALMKFRTSFQNARTKIDAVDPNNLTEVATALPDALAPLQELSELKDPSADLKSNPQLEAAAKQAPNCKIISLAGN